MDIADRLLGAASRLAAVIAGIGLVAIIVLTVADVGGRSIAGTPVATAVPLSQTALVGLVFLAMPYAQRQGAHVAMGILTERLTRRASGALQAAGLLIAFVPLSYLAWQTGDIALASFQRGETALGLVRVPVWPARAAITVGLALLALEVARAALLQLNSMRDPSAIPDPDPIEVDVVS